MKLLVRYISSYPNSKCLCRNVAEIKSFVRELISKTRPYLDEKRREEVAEHLIERAVRQLEEKRISNNCCERNLTVGKQNVVPTVADLKTSLKAAKQSPNLLNEEKLESHGDVEKQTVTQLPNTKEFKAFSAKKTSPRSAQAKNTRCLQDVTNLRNLNGEVTSVASPVVKLLRVPAPSAKKSGKELPFMYQVKYITKKDKKVQTNIVTPQRDKTTTLVENKVSGSAIKANPVQVMLKSETRESTKNVQTDQQSSTATNAAQLLNGLNINLNITVNGGCNASQNKTTVEYVRKSTKKQTKELKRRSTVPKEETMSPDLHVIKLNEFEAPVLLPRLTSELDHLQTELRHIQKTIDRLKVCGFEETDHHYLWDDFVL